MARIKLSELTQDTLVAMRKVGSGRGEYLAETVDGRDITHLIRRWVRKTAFKDGEALRYVVTKSGGFQWRRAPMKDFDTLKKTAIPIHADVAETVHEPAGAHIDVVKFLKDAIHLKPENLVIDEVKWRYLVRSALRGKNVLMTGPSGCGKTLAAQCLHKALNDRPYYYFNLGAMQDPRSSLIGNTHFKKDEGTYVAEALFVKAIQTPHALLLLDEISRAHPDAANILMTVLDENQRYLRIDERDDSPTIKVAEGVTFLATANIGTEYTAARVMDRALLDRFIRIEMEPLDLAREKELLVKLFPKVDADMLRRIAEIACHTRDQVKTEDPKITDIVSTRQSVEMASLLFDGFGLDEAAAVCVFPFYSSAGGSDSERTYMMQLVQKHLPTKYDKKDKPWEKDEASKIPFDINP